MRGSARSRRSRKAAISSTFVRFSMKYSSTSSLAVERDFGEVRVCVLMTARWPRRRCRRRLFEIPEHVDTPDHDVPVDLVHVEGLPDRPSIMIVSDRPGAPGIRPARASTLAESLSAVQMLAELGHVHRQPERRQAAQMIRRQSSSGRKPGQIGIGACRAPSRSRRPRRGAAGGRSAARACAPTSGRSPAAATTRARRDRRRSRCATGAAPAQRRITCSIADLVARPQPRRRAPRGSSKNAGSLMSAALIASDTPARQSRSGSVPRKPTSLMTANGGANVPR